MDTSGALRGSRMAIVWGALAAAIGILLLPGVADASTASVVNGQAVFTAAPGEANVVTVGYVGGSYRFEDAGAPLQPGAGCAAVAGQVRCPSAQATMKVDLGDRDDSVNAAPAGRGCTCNGGKGADRLTGGSREDTLSGGDEADTLDGKDDGDLLLGGAGVDTTTYAGRTDGVRVTIDGVQDDGNSKDGALGTPRDRVDTENVIGGSGSDALTGGGGKNTLRGEGGNDALTGASGADGLIGGEGTDKANYTARLDGVEVTLDGQPNDGNLDDGPLGARDNVATDVEDLAGGAGDDRLTGDGDANAMDGFGGADAIKGGGGSDTASYVSRTPAVTVTLDNQPNDGNADDGPAGARDNVMGDVENLIGGLGSDSLIGNGAANTFDGGNGADDLRGGGGIDTTTYLSRANAVTVTVDGVANDGGTLDGGGDNVNTENVTGSTERDSLTGGGGPNVLRGEGADDVLKGASGADVLVGGDGTDEVSYDGRLTGVDVTLDGQPNDGNADDGPAGARDNVGTDVENITGGAGDDALAGDEDANRFDGRAGADEMTGGGGTDLVTYESRVDGVVVSAEGQPNDGNADDGPVDARDNVMPDIENLTGGSGNDTLTGTPDTNVLRDGEGNDILNGGAGADQLLGTFGDDTLRGNEGNDSLSAGDGTNRMEGGNDADQISPGSEGTGEEGTDRIVGGSGVDAVSYLDREQAVSVTLDDIADDGYGSEGDNLAPDIETLIGGAGDDSLSGSDIANTLIGGTTTSSSGEERFSGSDRLVGNGGNDVLSGEDSGDSLDGGPGDDNLTGDRHPDHLTGGEGNDTLMGGGHGDSLTGGDGNDALVGQESVDTYSGGAGDDSISSRDGNHENVACGDGLQDFAEIDSFDNVSVDCEFVDS